MLNRVTRGKDSCFLLGEASPGSSHDRPSRLTYPLLSNTLGRSLVMPPADQEPWGQLGRRRPGHHMPCLPTCLLSPEELGAGRIPSDKSKHRRQCRHKEPRGQSRKIKPIHSVSMSRVFSQGGEEGYMCTRARVCVCGLCGAYRVYMGVCCVVGACRGGEGSRTEGGTRGQACDLNSERLLNLHDTELRFLFQATL